MVVAECLGISFYCFKTLKWKSRNPNGQKFIYILNILMPSSVNNNNKVSTMISIVCPLAFNQSVFMLLNFLVHAKKILLEI